jgi:hypothetical protein
LEVAAFLGIFRKKTIPRLKFARKTADIDLDSKPDGTKVTAPRRIVR